MPLRRIHEIELAAIDEIHVITNLADQTVKVHKFYIDCSELLGIPDFIAGYCDGEATPYILVRWDLAGRYHGQPASVAYLQAQGVKL